MGWQVDMDDERVARIALNRLTEPGDRLMNLVISDIGVGQTLEWLTASHASTPPGLKEDPRWESVTRNWRARLAGLNPRRDLEIINKLEGKVVIPTDPIWPSSLNDLGDSTPLCLWVRGEVDALQRPSVGIVGARACTGYGERVTADLVHGLADAGFLVVSGGAFGIDAVAHRTALEQDEPTVVFSAGGVDRFYPVAHTQMCRQVIARGGAIVSELPPGSAPMRHRFLQRNRLIAGLTQGIVVVEAAWRSGALNTARHAGELLRPVGAVPGPVTSMASAGCHRLIRDGMAVCVTDASEVVELVGPIQPEEINEPCQPGLLDGLDPHAARVFEALPKRRPATVEALVHVSGLAPAAVIAALGTLQLAGRVAHVEGKWKRQQ